MKITIFQVLALSLVANMAAQNAEQRAKIISNYDKTQIQSLNADIQARENLRELNVNRYLSVNTEAKLEYFANGTKYRMVDVINGQPLYISTDNASEAVAIRTNRLYPGGALGLSLEGTGMNAGIWDGGWILASHQEFMVNGVSKVTIGDGTGATTEQHGTHVAGTVAAQGINSSAKGMAPKANILSYNWSNDVAEVSGRAAEGLLVSNHSYGVPIHGDNGAMQVPSWYPGCYNGDARTWDQVAVTYENYIMVKSAGNEGAAGYTGGFKAGIDKLTGEAASKNNLVVANALTSVNPVLGTITDMEINTSSSQGPTDDGRIKPDITTDGTNVFSTSNGNNTEYANLTGTSMASPCATGSIVLLQEHYNNVHGHYMRSATVKGLICHTALDDFDYPGPDPRYGWGLMDTAAAATLITNSATNSQSVVLEAVLNNNGDYVYNFNVGAAGVVKATLCWTDPAGASQEGQLNSLTPALVNDLDLRITSNGTTYYPWKLNMNDLDGGAIKGDNLVDNVERVDIDEAQPGQYTLTVSKKGTLSGGSQKYSLILTGTGLSLDTDASVLQYVTVWPNPAKDVVNINFIQPLQNAQVALVDMAGRVVYQSKASGQGTIAINTGGFAKGVYMLNVTSDNKSLSKKIVIE